MTAAYRHIVEEHINKCTLSNQELDGCEFYLLQERQPSGIMLCRHERTEAYPVSFTLIFCPNVQGVSEVSSYKIFGAEIYYTATVEKLEKSPEKHFTPVITVSTDSESFLRENQMNILDKTWDSILDANGQYDTLNLRPYPEIIKEAKRILQACKENHMPTKPKTK